MRRHVRDMTATMKITIFWNLVTSRSLEVATFSATSERQQVLRNLAIETQFSYRIMNP
jgi:hypothetical protein